MEPKVIRPGVVETGRRIKGGFNLNKFVKELLRSMGFADTVDCCTYYPTSPTIFVLDENNPTEEEMTGIPIKGVFFAQDSNGGWTLRVRTGVNSSAEITSSN